MECVFLNAAGVALFVRDDMLSGHWIQQEMNVSAEFPYKAGKVIQIGQRMAFRDPATDTIEVFEIVNVQNREPDHAQTVTADHICIAELSDEHINTTEITNKTASEALSTALTGTLWSVGTNTASGAQNGNFSRGSVWDAVCEIQKNWNVYITPRVVISSGVITGRYLDIAPADGVWRGMRLSIRKNLLDPIVTYDDTEVYTALYGYGGMVDKSQQSGDDTSEELTFADQVWTATSSHPAKPSGQTYLEWPEKTAIYGRNGRARYGYYQNGNIKDAATLLQKTWESLQKASEPRVTVSGTCVDLYRLGYKDQPIRLHDIAIVEIEETGELLHKQVVCCDVDLVVFGDGGLSGCVRTLKDQDSVLNGDRIQNLDPAVEAEGGHFPPYIFTGQGPNAFELFHSIFPLSIRKPNYNNREKSKKQRVFGERNHKKMPIFGDFLIATTYRHPPSISHNL